MLALLHNVQIHHGESTGRIQAISLIVCLTSRCRPQAWNCKICMTRVTACQQCSSVRKHIRVLTCHVRKSRQACVAHASCSTLVPLYLSSPAVNDSLWLQYRRGDEAGSSSGTTGAGGTTIGGSGGVRSRFRLREPNNRQEHQHVASAIQASMDSAAVDAARREAEAQAQVGKWLMIWSALFQPCCSLALHIRTMAFVHGPLAYAVSAFSSARSDFVLQVKDAV